MFLGEFILKEDKLKLIVQYAYKAGYDKAKSGEYDSLKEGWDYASMISHQLIDEINERDLKRIRDRAKEE